MFLPHQNFAPISVVVPCYACAYTIERAICSVIAQTSLPREVILVDDASPDNTWQVLQHLAARYAGWIKVFRLDTNQGAASARNAGWALVTQPFIAFLDADDSWHPEKVRVQFGYMQSHPHIGLSGHGYEWGKVDERWEVEVSEYKASSVSAKALLMRSYFPTPSVMLKTSLPLRFREKQRYSEDALLWQQLAFEGAGIVRLEISLLKLHKAPYGVGGLSAQLWAMECAELHNFLLHYQSKKVGLITLLFVASLSLAKFTKRLLVHAWRRLP